METKIEIHNSGRQFERSKQLLMRDSSICEDDKKLKEITWKEVISDNLTGS
ncbi:MAG: hypothetical protein WC584_01715 [Candidatus Pacearchaeota archaeon]